MGKTVQAPPSYIKIQQYVLDRVRSGEYKVGSKIPSEEELAEAFKVSRVTANKAIKELSLTGILKREKGKGTFVTSNRELKAVNPSLAQVFSATVKMNEVEFRSHQLIQFKILEEIYPEIAQMVGAPGKEPMYEIVLSNKSKEAPDSIDVIYIPCAMIPDIVPSLEHIRTRSVFDYIKMHSNRAPKYMKIYVNSIKYDFLAVGKQHLGTENVNCWSAGIYDADMQFISVTYTICPNTDQNLPFVTLSF